uniref:Voltage-dependent anion-selective channel protein 1 n=1 Tax=Meloidogyne hapla TaxID=6305 RepID=A0A1I8B1V4_MELHA
MAPPPQFTDFGKSTKDLFTKGYTHGLLKLDVKSKSGPNVEFKSEGEHNLSTQKIKNKLELKYKIPEYGERFYCLKSNSPIFQGTTITESLNTANQLGSILELNNQLAKGLKVTIDTKYTPNSGKREALLKTDFSGDLVRLNANLSLVGAPVLEVFGATKIYNDWLAGAKAKYDLQANELKASSFGFLHQTSDYALHTFTNDGKEFGARSQVTIAATHNLSSTVKLTFTSQFGLAGLPDTSNKFGVGLEYAQ